MSRKKEKTRQLWLEERKERKKKERRRSSREQDDKFAGDSGVSPVKRVLAEVGKNDKYVGHFPELWFGGFRKRAEKGG